MAQWHLVKVRHSGRSAATIRNPLSSPDYSWASVASRFKGMSGAGFATEGRADVADTTLSTPTE